MVFFLLFLQRLAHSRCTQMFAEEGVSQRMNE